MSLVKVCVKFIGNQPVDQSWVDDDHVFGTWEDGSTHIQRDVSKDTYGIAASLWSVNHVRQA